MATTRKGQRTITVRGEDYRWMVRRAPKYWDNHGRKSLRFVVESARGGLLIVELNRPRLDYWWPVAGEELVPVTPREVAGHIESALDAGWTPGTQSKPFLVAYLRFPPLTATLPVPKIKDLTANATFACPNLSGH